MVKDVCPPQAEPAQSLLTLRASQLDLQRGNPQGLGRGGHGLGHQSSSTHEFLQPPSTGAQGAAGTHQQQLNNRRTSSVLRRPPVLTIGSILNKTYYRVDSHQPESLDWFNVLIAQTIAQFRNDAQHNDAILTSLTKALNGTSRPDFLDEIRVTELSLGEDFPIFSNCRIIPVDEDGYATNAGGGGGGGGAAGLAGATRLQARMDVDLSDMITLAVETKLLLNYPRRLSAVLPVALAVSVVRFSGTLSVSFVPSNPSQATPTKMIFAFLDDYRLDFSIRSLLGSRSRLQDVPKIAQLIESRLHRWFDERAVEPRFQEIELPSLWPRMRNARGGGAGPPSEDVSMSDGGAQAGGSGAASGGAGGAGGAGAARTGSNAMPTSGNAAGPASAAGPTGAGVGGNGPGPANGGLDVLRQNRPESRDSRDSVATRDTRDPRREAETESWVERQVPPSLHQHQSSLSSISTAQGQSHTSGYVSHHQQHTLRPSQDSLRFRRRSRHDDGFSMPGSLPDMGINPHG
ncbi:mitochondrion biogenesis protein [Sporothrix brasiliensis 5110]|uniref:Maintenance of mitochondrial morphology protein 1 n=1 Tax=Sporothrix brasiliensis 5110 TaxID=1398154 RepID=A0A0C2IV79_9PEZI|nr:mitochondrion biogenesis protein [Sporothrix brasiliensis 5110]KIH90670.1 mitochondrion biogenesis protein [Sporothrix brasiliensis 5110]